MRRWQDRLNPIQNHIGGGCNLNRDVAGPIEAVSPCITKLDRYYNPGEPKAFGAM